MSFNLFYFCAFFLVLIDARQITFKNNCPATITVSNTNSDVCPNLGVGASCTWQIPSSGYNGRFFRKNSKNDGSGYPSATLAEVQLASNAGGQWNWDWFDISIIPPGCSDATSYSSCVTQAHGADGYDVGMQMKPLSCTSVTRTCLTKPCNDAYQYPKDDTKTTVCQTLGNWEITFCPAGSVNDGDVFPSAPKPVPVAPKPVPVAPKPVPVAPKASPVAPKASPVASSGCTCHAKAGASTDSLQAGLNWVCSGQINCAPINSGGANFNPNTVQDHASWAYNAYYQQYKATGGTCDFSGSATLTCAEAPVAPKPVPVAPKPVPVAPKPVPVAPKPVPVAPKPVPVSPPPTASSTGLNLGVGTPGSSKGNSGATGAVNIIQYVNVGGSGSYPRVTNMIPNNGVWNQCVNPAANACVKDTKQISGPLAPFNEDLGVAFRGPMTLFNIAVFQPSGGSWSRVSSWNNGNSGTQNLVWMANQGGDANGGTWSICHGNSQSFVSSDGKSGVSSAQPFSGNIADGLNLNIMSGQRYTGSDFSRPVAMNGWTGNSCGEKLFAFKVQMPNSGANLPAIWFLNGNIFRTNQWGCNCRGMGAAGGCGELDFVEVITGQPSNQGTSTLYGFKQSLGAGAAYFERPTSGSATFVALFSAAGSGSITLFRMPDDSFPWSSTSISNAQINGWLATQSGKKATVNLGSPYTGAACAGAASTSSGATKTEAERVAAVPVAPKPVPVAPKAASVPVAAQCKCQAKPGASTDALQGGLNWVCNGQINCAPINSGGANFNPNTVQDHASWAYNAYYQQYKATGGTCDFSGSAQLSCTSAPPVVASQPKPVPVAPKPVPVAPKPVPVAPKPVPAPKASCARKRGVAHDVNNQNQWNTLKAASWFYNWSPNDPSKATGIEFVPMIWGAKDLTASQIASIPSGAKYLLGFNEPNFKEQSNLSPQDAARLWPQVEQIAQQRGLKLVGPALNYCGGACWNTSPFDWLDQFFAACNGCLGRLDAIGAHWYNCDLPSLQSYIGQYSKYGKPVWLTEFACGAGGPYSMDANNNYMNAAVAWLESTPSVARYSWFSVPNSWVPNVALWSGSSLTQLGNTYNTKSLPSCSNARIEEEPAPETIEPTTEESSSSPPNTAVLIGVPIGVVCAVILIAAIVALVVLKKRHVEERP